MYYDLNGFVLFPLPDNLNRSSEKVDSSSYKSKPLTRKVLEDVRKIELISLINHR